MAEFEQNLIGFSFEPPQHQHSKAPQTRHMSGRPHRDGDGHSGHPRDEEEPGEPRGSSRRGECHEHSPMQIEEMRAHDNHSWMWNTTLQIVYHLRGCQVCMEYGRHIMEAELTKDEEYSTTYQERKEEMDFWKSRANRYLDELEDAEAEVHRLQAQVMELEQRIEAGHDHGDTRKGKQACYGSPYGGESGVESPMVPMLTSGTPAPPVQESTGYAQML